MLYSWWWNCYYPETIHQRPPSLIGGQGKSKQSHIRCFHVSSTSLSSKSIFSSLSKQFQLIFSRTSWDWHILTTQSKIWHLKKYQSTAITVWIISGRPSCATATRHLKVSTTMEYWMEWELLISAEILNSFSLGHMSIGRRRMTRDTSLRKSWLTHQQNRIVMILMSKGYYGTVIWLRLFYLWEVQL